MRARTLCWKTTLAALACLALACFASACLPTGFTGTPTLYDPSLNIRPTAGQTADSSPTSGTTAADSESTATDSETTAAGSQNASETTFASTPSTASMPGTTTPSTPSASAADFKSQAKQLLLAGLQRQDRSISLDAAIEPHTIANSAIEDTIDLVFDAYQQIYLENPVYFYLNGSINVGYSMASSDGDLVSMTVKPEYRESMTGLAPSELSAMMAEIDSAATQIASQIASQSGTPWQQLQLLHDRLVSSIAYDTSLNQENNQVYSALIKKTTLCQGYAQAFQLIAQRLGFETLMIMGETDGVGHAWTIVRLDSRWYHVDVTFDDPTPDGGPAEPVSHVHFLRSDAVMADSHTWDKADYPACPEDGAHYFTRQGLTVDSLTALDDRLRAFIAGIDYSAVQKNRLELLFLGSPPSAAQLEELVRAALRDTAPGQAVLFSQQISKGILTVDITPDT